FFIDPPPPELYTLSLHDALPIFDPPGYQSLLQVLHAGPGRQVGVAARGEQRVDLLGQRAGQVEQGGRVRLVEIQRVQVEQARQLDRKSTRLNSSHVEISYAVFCL